MNHIIYIYYNYDNEDYNYNEREVFIMNTNEILNTLSKDLEGVQNDVNNAINANISSIDKLMKLQKECQAKCNAAFERGRQEMKANIDSAFSDSLKSSRKWLEEDKKRREAFSKEMLKALGL